MSTRRSRGNESSEIEFVFGSARIIMIVSERDGSFASEPARVRKKRPRRRLEASGYPRRRSSARGDRLLDEPLRDREQRVRLLPDRALLVGSGPALADRLDLGELALAPEPARSRLREVE